MTKAKRGTVEMDEQIEKARRGDVEAFDRVYATHAESCWRLALAVERDHAVAGGAVADAFARVLAPGHRPPVERPIQVQLLAATRAAALDGQSDPAAVGLPSGATAAAALQPLPERWRSVLWLTEVERVGEFDAAAVLGLSTRSTTELAERARAGWREQLAQGHVQAAETGDCRRTTARLAGYVTTTLSPRDEVRVRRHLDRCAACRHRLDEVDDLGPELRRSAPALPLSVHPLAVERWRAMPAASTGPLGLRLPGGRPVPVWAERALTGATAAVITLGITTAILASGRGANRERTGPLASADTEQPLGAADGESALGTGDETSIGVPDDGPVVTPPTDDPAPTAPTAASSPSAPVLSRGSADLGGSPAPSTGTGTPTPATPTTPTTPTTPDEPTTPPPSPTTTTPPAVTIRVDDNTGVSVGGDCTGVEILGVVVLCDPPPTGSLLP